MLWKKKREEEEELGEGKEEQDAKKGTIDQKSHLVDCKNPM